jgi:hypothetical protein
MKRSLVWLPVTGIVLAVAAGCGSTTHKASSSSTSAPSSTSSAPSSTSSAPPASSSAPPSGSSGSALNDIVLGTWRNGIALDEATVSIDVLALQNIVRVGADKDIESACSELIPDVKTLQQDPAAPDSPTNTPWQQALSEMTKGGNECYSAAPAQNAAELTAADNEIVAGNIGMTAVTNKVALETGGPPDVNFNSSSPLSSADTQSLQSWLNLVSNDQSNIGVDLSDTVADATAQDFDAWQADCTTTANDVKTLQKDASPPVASTNTLWQQSLALYIKGATECVAGTTMPQDLSKLKESNTDVATANNDQIEVGLEALGA